jgi:hypothetical protein
MMLGSHCYGFCYGFYRLMTNAVQQGMNMKGFGKKNKVAFVRTRVYKAVEGEF